MFIKELTDLDTATVMGVIGGSWLVLSSNIDIALKLLTALAGLVFLILRIIIAYKKLKSIEKNDEDNTNI